MNTWPNYEVYELSEAEKKMVDNLREQQDKSDQGFYVDAPHKNRSYWGDESGQGGQYGQGGQSGQDVQDTRQARHTRDTVDISEHIKYETDGPMDFVSGG